MLAIGATSNLARPREVLCLAADSKQLKAVMMTVDHGLLSSMRHSRWTGFIR